jgi:hypothetical protein
MTKKLIHWTYRDVADFLVENDFSFSEVDGSVRTWVKLADNGEPERFVQVPFSTSFYSEKALKKIVGQSGIPEKDWNKWAFKE